MHTIGNRAPIRACLHTSFSFHLIRSFLFLPFKVPTSHHALTFILSSVPLIFPFPLLVLSSPLPFNPHHFAHISRTPIAHPTTLFISLLFPPLNSAPPNHQLKLIPTHSRVPLLTRPITLPLVMHPCVSSLSHYQSLSNTSHFTLNIFAYFLPLSRSNEFTLLHLNRLLRELCH